MTPHAAVSDPAQELLGALVSVERRLATAADLADRLTASLRRRETDLVQIRVQARKGLHVGESRPSSHTTFELAAMTRRGLQHSTEVGDELLMLLEQTGKDLHLAREAISESAALAASTRVSSPDPELLPHWVCHLDRIIQSATEGAERAIIHLRSAEQAFGELAARPGAAPGERGQTARQVHAVVIDSESHIRRAKSTLGLARAFLEDGRLAILQGAKAARRLLAHEVLPEGIRHVRPYPRSAHGAAPASHKAAAILCSRTAEYRVTAGCNEVSCEQAVGGEDY